MRVYMSTAPIKLRAVVTVTMDKEVELSKTTTDDDFISWVSQIIMFLNNFDFSQSKVLGYIILIWKYVSAGN